MPHGYLLPSLSPVYWDTAGAETPAHTQPVPPQGPPEGPAGEGAQSITPTPQATSREGVLAAAVSSPGQPGRDPRRLREGGGVRPAGAGRSWGPLPVFLSSPIGGRCRVSPGPPGLAPERGRPPQN